jgi:hypothetical protein
MANKSESGFKAEQKKKLNTERTSQTIIKRVVFGDALVCLYRAIQKLGLETTEVSMIIPTPFGVIEAPFVHHTTDEGVMIPYGAYQIDGLGKVTPSDSKTIVPELTLSVTFERGANEKIWDKLLEHLYDELKTHESMFRGRALRIMAPTDMVVPQYIDLTNEIPLFLNEEVEKDVETNIFFPITHAEELKEMGLSGYRGILLHGNYGTGKSLIAYETARRSIAKGRTFILCSSNMLREAIAISRFMEPSSLFVEDMDSVSMGYSNLSALRNTLSGIESKKGFDVVLILTTNLLSEVEKMDRSLLRPDRIDAIVEIPPPNVNTVARIIQFHGKGWLDNNASWDSIYASTAQSRCTPAIIVDVLKRSKIVSLGNNRVITPEIMSKQLAKMTRQIELSEPKKPLPISTATQLAESIKQIAYYGND